MPLSPLFIKPGAPLPTVEHPFLVLIDVNDKEWLDDGFLCETCKHLLDGGCTWFACFGERAGEVHDRIDDIIVERIYEGREEYEGVVTTFHHDESEQEVAEFFACSVLPKLKGALVLAQDASKWEPYL